MVTETRRVVDIILKRLAARGHGDYTDRKIYTLAEFDWGSTYGFSEGVSKPDGHPTVTTPGGIYMIEGSPCRGVITVFQTWEGWRVHFVNSHFHKKLIVRFKDAESNLGVGT